MMNKKVLVVGANGVVGFATMKHFSLKTEAEVIAISRRTPSETFGSTFYSLDLLDDAECERVIGQLEGITHIVYCAVYEKKSLREGWLNQDQIDKNEKMLKNVMSNLKLDLNPLKHVTFLQGTKAYGTHIGEFKIPARENRSERKDIPNFYWKQEDYMKKLQLEHRTWTYTIFRPRIIFGEAIGSAMNIIPAIGVYGAILKELGEPLHYPGKQTSVIMQAVDADLLAKGIEWAGESDKAANEIFNITNGDIFVWNNVWPVIAESLNMQIGEHRPVSLQEFMQDKKELWNVIREKYNLLSPSIDRFVNTSFEYADGYLNADPSATPAYSSTIKLYQAGFHEFLDTEEMFKKWFVQLRDRKLIP